MLVNNVRISIGLVHGEILKRREKLIQVQIKHYGAK